MVPAAPPILIARTHQRNVRTMPHSSTHEVTIRRGNIASTWVPWRLASWKKIHCRGRNLKRQATPCSQRPWRSMLRNGRIAVATQLQRNCNGSLSRGASAAYPAHHSAAPPLLHWQVALPGGRNTARRAVHAGGRRVPWYRDCLIKRTRFSKRTIPTTPLSKTYHWSPGKTYLVRFV